MEIGQIIKKRREALGMSQEELAKKVGYKSRSSINKIETDGRGLPQSKIKAFATALDTTPAYLMGWIDENGLTPKDERDIKKDLDSLMEKLTSKEYGPAAYDGEEIPEEDQELFAGQLELMLRRLKKINKVKYNPYKNIDKK